MKKLLAASALIFCAALSAFAQLSFSGKAYAGVQMAVPYEENEDGEREAVYTVTHREYGDPRFDFIAALQKENYGVKLDSTFTATSDPFRLNGIYGWADFLDNQLRLSVGKISDSSWVTTVNEYVLDKVPGFRAVYTAPGDSLLGGLNLGIAFDFSGDIQQGTGNSTERFFKQTILGAGYIHPLFNTLVTYDIGSNGNLIWGFNYTGIARLTTAAFELKASEVASWDKTGKLSLTEKAVYQIIQRAGVLLRMDQEISGVEDSKAGLSFTPGVSYRATREATVFLEATIGTTDSFDKKENSWFALKPYCEFALKGPALFYVEYELRLDEFKHDSHRFAFGLDIKAF